MAERERPGRGRDSDDGHRRGGPRGLARERDEREVGPDREPLGGLREPAQKRGHDPQREQPAGQRGRPGREHEHRIDGAARRKRAGVDPPA